MGSSKNSSSSSSSSPASLSSPPPPRGSCRSLVVVAALFGQVALLCVFVVAQTSLSSSSKFLLVSPVLVPPQAGAAADAVSVDAAAAHHRDSDYPLAIPPGQPPNLPRIEVRADEAPPDESVAESKRGIYGGKGDGKHLGGFTEFDPAGVAPDLWAKMITEVGVKSMMDIGCGKGVSSRWFLEHNVKVLCVEGSHDAVSQSFLPPEAIVEHDYSRGPWWPMDTYDAAWSVEFLEHVSRQHMHNYIQTLRKAAILFVTSSRWGGWHHVEIHNDEWWIRKFTSYGFVYDEKLTATAKSWAASNGKSNYTLPTGKKAKPGHVTLSMKVFLNPAVAALPRHAHLFAEPGCRGDRRPDREFNGGKLRYKPRECGTGTKGGMETALAESFLPLTIDPSMHERWVAAIKAGLKLPEATNDGTPPDEEASNLADAEADGAVGDADA